MFCIQKLTRSQAACCSIFEHILVRANQLQFYSCSCERKIDSPLLASLSLASCIALKATSKRFQSWWPADHPSTKALSRPCRPPMCFLSWSLAGRHVGSLQLFPSSQRGRPTRRRAPADLRAKRFRSEGDPTIASPQQSST